MPIGTENDPLLQMLLSGMPLDIASIVGPRPILGPPHAAPTGDAAGPAPGSGAATSPRAGGGGLLNSFFNMNPDNVYVAPGPLPVTSAPQAGGGVWKALAQGIGLATKAFASAGEAKRQREKDALTKKSVEADIGYKGALTEQTRTATAAEKKKQEEADAARKAKVAAWSAVDPETLARIDPSGMLAKMTPEQRADAADVPMNLQKAEDLHKMSAAQIDTMTASTEQGKTTSTTEVEKTMAARMKTLDALKMALALKQGTSGPGGEQNAAFLAAHPELQQSLFTNEFMTMPLDLLQSRIAYEEKAYNFDVERLGKINPESAARLAGMLLAQKSAQGEDPYAAFGNIMKSLGYNPSPASAAANAPGTSGPPTQPGWLESSVYGPGNPFDRATAGPYNLFGMAFDAEGGLLQNLGQFLGTVAETGTQGAIQTFANVPSIRQAIDNMKQQLSQGANADDPRLEQDAIETLAAQIVARWPMIGKYVGHEAPAGTEIRQSKGGKSQNVTKAGPPAPGTGPTGSLPSGTPGSTYNLLVSLFQAALSKSPQKEQ